MAEIKHGTEGGARAHYRRGQKPCAACNTAANEAATVRAAKRADAVPGDRAATAMLARREQAAEQIRAINRRDAQEAPA